MTSSVWKVSKEIGITRKFFGNLRRTLDTVRLTRGASLGYFRVTFKLIVKLSEAKCKVFIMKISFHSYAN